MTNIPPEQERILREEFFKWLTSKREVKSEYQIADFFISCLNPLITEALQACEKELGEKMGKLIDEQGSILSYDNYGKGRRATLKEVLTLLNLKHDKELPANK